MSRGTRASLDGRNGLVARPAAAPASAPPCCDPALCGRCILYVGGRTRHTAHFKSLVRRQGGRFMHHDGGMHGGRARLPGALERADAVFCPLDCVSHDAAVRIKRYCKREQKPLVLLRSASLSAFEEGLRGVGW